jgi:hypothetical protein
MARVKKYEADTEALLEKAPLPPASEWRRAPFLRSENDRFWANVQGYFPIRGDPSIEYLLFSGEVAASEADMIDPSSILRLRIERGDFPFSAIQYKAIVQPPKDWADWVDAVLANDEYRKTLDQVGLLKAVRASRDLSMTRSQRDLDFAISRWSTTSHTFVFSSFEAAPTLLDTEVLLGLPTRGAFDFNPNDPTLASRSLAEQIDDEFKAAGQYGSRYDRQGKERKIPETNKTTWATWQQFWFRDIACAAVDGVVACTMSPRFEGPMYFGAFLVEFLSLFLFPDTPHEGPRRKVIPLAATIATGKRLPLGPLFLGFLYHQLDRTVKDFERSMGRYEITSMVHIQFLLGWFYEHFPAAAPKPQGLPRLEVIPERNAAGEPINDVHGRPILVYVGERLPRIMRWNNTHSDFILEDWCDEISSFAPRPYSKYVDGAVGPSVITEDAIEDFHGKSIRGHKLDLLCWITPSFLPTFAAEGPILVLYRADRLQMQFGFDQGVPSGPPSPPASFYAAIRRFLKMYNNELTAGYGGEKVIPSSHREPAFTPENRVYWARNLQSFLDFVQTAPVVPPAEPISKRDLTLRSFKPGKHADWRGLYSCWVDKTMIPPNVIAAIPLSKIRPAEQKVIPSRSSVRTKRKVQAESSSVEEPASKRAREASPPKIEKPPKRARVSLLFFFYSY